MKSFKQILKEAKQPPSFDGFKPEVDADRDAMLHTAATEIQKTIQKRRSISNADGSDTSGESIVKGSPLDPEGQSPLQYAKNLQKFDPSMRRKLSDPLNIQGMGLAASIVDSLRKGEMDKARSAEEHEQDDLNRLKEIDDTFRQKYNSNTTA
jgi:hypothetical protein